MILIFWMQCKSNQNLTYFRMGGRGNIYSLISLYSDPHLKNFRKKTYPQHSSNPLFLKGELTLTKIPRKGGSKNCWRVGGILRKEGDAVSLGIFSSWGVTNVTTVTFNYILVIEFLFPLNVGVSSCSHCTVLVPVYRVYTSCFHNTVNNSCYRLHTSVCMMQVLLFVTVWTFLKCVISQELVGESTQMV